MLDVRRVLLISLSALLLAAVACNSGDADSGEDGDGSALGQVASELTAEWIEDSEPGLSLRVEQIDPMRLPVGTEFAPKVTVNFTPGEHPLQGANSVYAELDVIASGSVSDLAEFDLQARPPITGMFSSDRTSRSSDETGGIGLICVSPGPGTYTVFMQGRIAKASEESEVPLVNYKAEPGKVLRATGTVECFEDNSQVRPTETPTGQDIRDNEPDPDETVEVEYVEIGGERFPVTQFEIEGSAGAATGRIGIRDGQIYISIDNPDIDDWVLPDEVEDEFGDLSGAMIERNEVRITEWLPYCIAVNNVFEFDLIDEASAEACEGNRVEVPDSSGTGDTYEVLVINGNFYPVTQFTEEVFGDGTVYSTEPGQLIFSFDAPGQPIVPSGDFVFEVDPGLFDDATEVEKDTIQMQNSVIVPFCESVGERTTPDIVHYSPVRELCGELIEPNPAPARPTATPATRGVLVTVLKIGDAHYYIHQFDHLRSPGLPNGDPGQYLCGDNQYAVHLAAFLTVARSFEYPDEPLEDPDVTGCGFGLTEEFADPESTHSSVLQADFPQVRFTAKVIGEWCRRVLPDLAGQNPAIQNLCERNPPQD